LWDISAARTLWLRDCGGWKKSTCVNRGGWEGAFRGMANNLLWETPNNFKSKAANLIFAAC
jgi:hypothetical protein